MDDKSKLELYKELDIVKKEEREISDKSYSPMVVKFIVFGMVGIILSYALKEILSKVFTK